MFSDNWYLIEGPGQPSALLLLGRLVQLALLGISGIAGYLCVRRWGLAVAIGGALPIVWLAASTLFDLTDTPVGPGLRQPGRGRDRAARRDDHRRQRGGGDRHPGGRRGLRPERRASAVRQNVQRDHDRVALRQHRRRRSRDPRRRRRRQRRHGARLRRRRAHDAARGGRARGVRASDGACRSRSPAAPPPTPCRSSALCPPWGAVLCHETAHILNSECGVDIAARRRCRDPRRRRAPTSASRPTSLHDSARQRSVGAIRTTRSRRCCRSRSRPTWARSTRSRRSPPSSPIASERGSARPHRRGPRRQRAGWRSTARPPT